MFPAGTEIAFEIHNALKNSKFITLYGATSVPCHADMVFKRCFDVPFVDEPGLIDALNRITDVGWIDYIYPAHDSALLRLTRDREILHAKVITSDLKTVEVCRNKNKTYEYLDGKYYIPKHYASPDDVTEFPVFVKPSVGQGSEGAEKIDDRAALYRKLLDGREYAICEYLPGAEYTVDCFTDRHGELRYVGQRTRDRIRSGIAVRSTFVNTDRIVNAMAHDINNRLSFNGAWFFQIKAGKYGQYKLMEIAPRIAGTMGLSRNRGINLPLLTVYNMLGMDVNILNNNKDILLDRAFISRFKTDVEYNTVYVDFDDTLIIDGKVNTQLIAFLYQAKNNKKRIILLSKHDGWLEQDLLNYGISPKLFTDIINIGMRRYAKTKADFVKPNSILIDDSFSERKLVHEKCGIPVFDVDMVESLYDWCA